MNDIDPDRLATCVRAGCEATIRGSRCRYPACGCTSIPLAIPAALAALSAAPRPPAAPSAADVGQEPDAAMAGLAEAMLALGEVMPFVGDAQSVDPAVRSWHRRHEAVIRQAAGAPSPMSAPEAAENAAARKEFGRQMDAEVSAAARDPRIGDIEAWTEFAPEGTRRRTAWLAVLSLLADLVSQRDRVREKTKEVRRVVDALITGDADEEDAFRAVAAAFEALGGGE
jgi:hypothetical protein